MSGPNESMTSPSRAWDWVSARCPRLLHTKVLWADYGVQPRRVLNVVVLARARAVRQGDHDILPLLSSHLHESLASW